MKKITYVILVILSMNSAFSNELLSLEKKLDEGEKKSHQKFAITEGARKKIVWFDKENPQKTKRVVLSLHGYTATRKEVEPLPQLLAVELEANLYMNRLKGHGQKKNLFEGITYKDWLRDVEKDLMLAQELGEEVIILAVSTGATLATYLVNKYPKKIKSVIYLSALFGPADGRSELLTIPFIGSMLRKRVLGKYRSWKPANEGQAKYWKHYYLSSAVTELVRLVQKVRRLPIKKFTTPSCWFYNPEDRVVSIKKLLKTYKKWGGEKSILSVEANDHVIAGDIMNPELTLPVLSLIKENCFLK